MSQTNKNKTLSPFVQAVLELDTYFSELTRLSSQIEKAELVTDADFDRTCQLMNHFNDCAQGVATGVISMSNALNEARAEAEEAADRVSKRAEEMQIQQSERQQKMEVFRALGEKVQNLTLSLGELKQPEGQQPSDDNRAKISMRLSELEMQLQPLIEEAKHLTTDAHNLKMAVLEGSAHSLSQSLIALSKKLAGLQQPSQMQ